MVAEGVVDLEAEVLLGFGVEVGKLRRAVVLGTPRGVEDVVAALDGEVGLDGPGCFKAMSVPWTALSSGWRWESVMKRKSKDSGRRGGCEGRQGRGCGCGGREGQEAAAV